MSTTIYDSKITIYDEEYDEMEWRDVKDGGQEAVWVINGSSEGAIEVTKPYGKRADPRDKLIPWFTMDLKTIVHKKRVKQ